MTAAAKPFSSTPGDDTEISMAELLLRLAPHGPRRLVFSYEGRDILPGYHVTEVKDGRFDALDCGGNPETWRETFIQLWDVPEGNSHMPVAKFVAIVRKVHEHVPFDATAKLTFEVSNGIEAIRLYRAELIEIAAEQVTIALSRRPASCKPRDRWLESEAACCSTKATEPCCPAP